MKIAVMLRHYEQHEGGVKVYTRNLLPHLFRLGEEHSFLLIYQNADLIGTYRDYANVEELAVPVPGTVTWDQLALPWVERKRPVDVIFNPKFTVPFFARAKKVFVLHGSEWFVIPECFLWYDRLYFKWSAPLYCRHADAFITVSKNVKRDAVEHTGVDPEKVFPVYNGYDQSSFRVIEDQAVLESIRRRYQLPARFILWVGQVYPPKNVPRLLRAVASVKDQIPHTLVMAGEERWNGRREIRELSDLGIQDRVQFLGWVSQDDLPAIYNLADLFVLPSLYEGFGIPLIEAMACGCPVVTSSTGSPPEVVHGAARLVDPLDVESIAQGIREVLENEELQEKMIRKGLDRASHFSWRGCASEVLKVLEASRRTT